MRGIFRVGGDCVGGLLRLSSINNVDMNQPFNKNIPNRDENKTRFTTFVPRK